MHISIQFLNNVEPSHVLGKITKYINLIIIVLDGTCQNLTENNLIFPYYKKFMIDLKGCEFSSYHKLKQIAIVLNGNITI